MKTKIVCINVFFVASEHRTFVSIDRGDWKNHRQYNYPTQASLRRLAWIVTHKAHVSHTDSRITVYHNGWKWEV